MLEAFIWCGREDLNLHGKIPLDPKSSASAVPPRPHETYKSDTK